MVFKIDITFQHVGVDLHRWWRQGKKRAYGVRYDINIGNVSLFNVETMGIALLLSHRCEVPSLKIYARIFVVQDKTNENTQLALAIISRTLEPNLCMKPRSLHAKDDLYM